MPIQGKTAAIRISGESLPHPPSIEDEGRRSDGVPPGPGDGDLVGRILGGEVEAYRPLVERYQRAVLALSTRLLGPGGDAEDLAQESFVRAYRYLPGLKERDRFGPWLFQVVRSLARDRIRSREAERKAIERRKEVLRWAAVPGGEGVGSALYRLPPEEYQVLRMRYFEGMSYEEIAERRSMTFSQVDHLIRKARERLGRIVERERRK